MRPRGCVYAQFFVPFVAKLIRIINKEKIITNNLMRDEIKA